MSYSAAFRPAHDAPATGYTEVLDPQSPWQELESAWAGVEPAPAWGTRNRNIGDIISEQLGGAASGIGRQILADPYVQAELEGLKADCKTKAKSGVNEWMVENKWYLIGGGAALVLGNFLMLTLAVLPAVERAARRRG